MPNVLKLPVEQTVTLVDGRVVSTYSPEWLHECEARSVLAMPSKDARHEYLYGPIDLKTNLRRGGIMKKRGEAGVKSLETTIMALWAAGVRS